jgi:hypothetical protein
MMRISPAAVWRSNRPVNRAPQMWMTRDPTEVKATVTASLRHWGASVPSTNHSASVR